MDDTKSWKQFFVKWPKDIPPRGVLVTTFEDQIMFDGFMTSDDLLLVERKAPDTTGARKVLLPYSRIAAVKFVDIVRSRSFEGLGFAGKLPRE